MQLSKPMRVIHQSAIPALVKSTLISGLQSLTPAWPPPMWARSAVMGSGGPTRDVLYDDAVSLISREGKASTSFIQRHLQIGYNRAARIIEQMESEGIVSTANRVGRREVLIGHHGL